MRNEENNISKRHNKVCQVLFNRSPTGNVAEWTVLLNSIIDLAITLHDIRIELHELDSRFWISVVIIFYTCFFPDYQVVVNQGTLPY